MTKKFQISLSGTELIKKKEAAFLKEKVKGVLRVLGLEKRLLTVHLCDDAEIKALNRRFRGKNKATDVLSFEATTTPDDPIFAMVLGDIVISVETAGRQAENAEHALKEELVVLFVHGLLHILGYDHDNSDEEALMQAEAELFLLSEIDVPVETALIGRQFYC